MEIRSNLHKITELGDTIATIEATLKSNRHVSTLIKTAHDITSSEFVLHMTGVALGNPPKYQHMYEWGMTGDPNAKLWKHVLKGGGRERTAYFEFKASRTTVPVNPKLQSVGVKRNHIFVWKAMVLENGLPVSISPKIAKYLVFLSKDATKRVSGSGQGHVSGGIVYYKGTINIAQAGNATIRGSFTDEYSRWWNSGEPERIIKDRLTKPAIDAIKKTVAEETGAFSNLQEKAKTFRMNITLDPLVEQKFAASLEKNYIGAAAQRRVIDD